MLLIIDIFKFVHKFNLNFFFKTLKVNKIILCQIHISNFLLPLLAIFFNWLKKFKEHITTFLQQKDVLSVSCHNYININILIFVV